MTDEPSDQAKKLPVLLLLLDFVGALLVVTGVMELFEPGMLVPETWRFGGYTWVAIVLGALLMAPFVRHSIRKAQAARLKDQ